MADEADSGTVQVENTEQQTEKKTDATKSFKDKLVDMENEMKNPGQQEKKAEEKPVEKSDKKEEKKTEKKPEKKEDKKAKGSDDELDLDALEKDQGLMSKKESSDDDDSGEADKKKETEVEDKYKDDLPEELPDGEENRREGWRKIKAVRNELAETLKERDDELSELKKNTEELTEKLNTSSLESPQYQQMEKEHKEMAELLEQLSFKDSLNYKKKYDAPMSALKKEIQGFLEGIEADVSVEQLLAKDRNAMMDAASELGEGMKSMQRRKFEQALDDVFDLKEQSSADLENAQEFNRNAEASNQYNQEKAFVTASKKIAEENDYFFKDQKPDNENDAEDVSTAAAMNEGRSKIPAMAKAILDKPIDETQATELAYNASIAQFFKESLMPRLEFEYKRDKKTINMLIGEIRKLREKNPNFNKGSDGGDGGAGKPKPSGDPEKDFKGALSGISKLV